MMSTGSKIAALCTVHNRSLLTSRIITQLTHQLSFIESDCGTDVDIFVVDDGSTDDTRERIERTFPIVEVIEGTGTMYWAGGMRHGWNYISRLDIEYDALLVFNDDVDLFPGAISSILALYRENADCIIVGSFLETREDTELSYGLLVPRLPNYLLTFDVLQDLRHPNRAKSFNMNLALIPARLLNTIGFLDPYYQHCKADIDFGLRCYREKIPIRTPASPIGVCTKARTYTLPYDNGLDLPTAWKRLISVKHQPMNERWYYCRKNTFVFAPICFLAPYGYFFLCRMRALWKKHVTCGG